MSRFQRLFVATRGQLARIWTTSTGRIVALLRENARRSFKDIGAHVHLSAPAVKRRVDRLEADGVIRGYTAMVDPRAFGWHAEAFVDLYCDGRMPADSIKRRSRASPGVVSAHTVAGEASALLHVHGARTRRTWSWRWSGSARRTASAGRSPRWCCPPCSNASR